jgi:hypothetical protein
VARPEMSGRNSNVRGKTLTKSSLATSSQIVETVILWTFRLMEVTRVELSIWGWEIRWGLRGERNQNGLGEDWRERRIGMGCVDGSTVSRGTD